MIDRVCSRCELKDTCRDYQNSLKDTDRVLFGCSREEEDGEEQRNMERCCRF